MEFSDNYSRGCETCQKGSWLCIYLTYICNAACSFCPAPFRNRDFIQSAAGNDPDVVLKNIRNFGFEGISFSGGECFLVYDRLLAWLDVLKKAGSGIYFWAYTNGLNIKAQQLEELARQGLNEIRFNIAASGYNDPSVMKTLAYAAEIFDHVAVEIPSIPEDYELVAGILPDLAESGVDYLNLHEYILVPGDPNTKTAPKGQYVMNYEMKMDFHRSSLANTEKIRNTCINNSWPFKINNCSLAKKENQMLARRKTMGTVLKEAHEKLTEDGFLETVYLPEKELMSVHEIQKNYHLADYSGFVHPDRFAYDKPGAFFVRLMPKLGIYDTPKVMDFKKIT